MKCWACGDNMEAMEKRGVRGRKLLVWRCEPCDLEQDRKAPPKPVQHKLSDPGRRVVQLPCATENSEQELFFNLVRRFQGRFPDLADTHMVPNGAYLAGGRRAGAKMIAMGLLPGVCDVCCPVPKNGYHGWYGELKRLRNEKPSEAQMGFIERVRSRGYWADWHKGGWAMWRDLCGYLGIALDENDAPTGLPT